MEKQHLFVKVQYGKRKLNYYCEDESVQIGDTVCVPIGNYELEYCKVVERKYYASMPYPCDFNRKVMPKLETKSRLTR
ncbi:MAG: hypothetical protein FWE16_02170 [Firmicutes bacterium]|nr:hypothetical protein [Bacillota bacterium]